MKSTGKFKAIIFIILLSVLLTACESTADVNIETASASDAEAATFTRNYLAGKRSSEDRKRWRNYDNYE